MSFIYQNWVERQGSDRDGPTLFQQLLAEFTWPRVIKWTVISIGFVGVCAVFYKMQKSSIEALKTTVRTVNFRNMTRLMGIIDMQNRIIRLEYPLVSDFKDRLVSNEYLEQQLIKIGELIEQNIESFEQLSLAMQSK